jgi:hypothetical protein
VEISNEVSFLLTQRSECEINGRHRSREVHDIFFMLKNHFQYRTIRRGFEWMPVRNLSNNGDFLKFITREQINFQLGWNRRVSSTLLETRDKSKSAHTRKQIYLKNIFDINSFDFLHDVHCLCEGRNYLQEIFMLMPLENQEQGMRVALCILQLVNIWCVSDLRIFNAFLLHSWEHIFFHALLLFLKNWSFFVPLHL